MDYESDKFIRAPMFTYNKVLRLLAGVVGYE